MCASSGLCTQIYHIVHVLSVYHGKFGKVCLKMLIFVIILLQIYKGMVAVHSTQIQ